MSIKVSPVISTVIVAVVVVISIIVAMSIAKTTSLFQTFFGENQAVDESYFVFAKTFEVEKDIFGKVSFRGWIITNETILSTDSPTLYFKIEEKHNYIFIVKDDEIMEVIGKESGDGG